MILSGSILRYLIPQFREVSDEKIEEGLLNTKIEISRIIEPNYSTFELDWGRVNTIQNEPGTSRYTYIISSLSEDKEYLIHNVEYIFTINKIVLFSKKVECIAEVITHSEILGLKVEENDYPIVLESFEIFFKNWDPKHFRLPRKIYHLNLLPIHSHITSIWVLAQELALTLNISIQPERPESLDSPFLKNSISTNILLFELRAHGISLSRRYPENLDLFLKLLFNFEWSKPEDRLSRYCSIFFLKNRYSQVEECNFHPKIYSIITSELPLLKSSERLKTEVKLCSLPYVFKPLVEAWETKVVFRLSRYLFEFKKIKKEIFTVIWPYWYPKYLSYSFSEILSRLIWVKTSPRKISHFFKPKYLLEERGKREGSSVYLRWLMEIKSYLKARGFIECNTSKFVPIWAHITSPKYVLRYNKNSTLRDSLSYSLVFRVLIPNLNYHNLIYPVFELSFSPWNSNWILGVVSTSKFKTYEKFDRALPLKGPPEYNFFDLQKIISELLYRVFSVQLNFRWIPGMNRRKSKNPFVSICYINISKIGNIGCFFVSRLEEFEVRKREIISAEMNLSKVISFQIDRMV